MVVENQVPEVGAERRWRRGARLGPGGPGAASRAGWLVVECSFSEGAAGVDQAKGWWWEVKTREQPRLGGARPQRTPRGGSDSRRRRSPEQLFSATKRASLCALLGNSRALHPTPAPSLRKGGRGPSPAGRFRQPAERVSLPFAAGHRILRLAQGREDGVGDQVGPEGIGEGNPDERGKVEAKCLGCEEAQGVGLAGEVLDRQVPPVAPTELRPDLLALEIVVVDDDPMARRSPKVAKGDLQLVEKAKDLACHVALHGVESAGTDLSCLPL